MPFLFGADNLMTLNKKICQKCCKVYANKNGLKYVIAWSEDDWRKGCVWCIPGYQQKKGPPPKCPYILEHIISNEDMV